MENCEGLCSVTTVHTGDLTDAKLYTVFEHKELDVWWYLCQNDLLRVPQMFLFNRKRFRLN